MDQFIQFGIGGIVIGCVYAIAASGLVLTYTTTGVFNFAHGAVGGFCAFVYWWVTVDRGVPVVIGLPLVVLVFAPALGALLELFVFRNFRRAPIETTLVVTIALTLFFVGVTTQLFDEQIPRNLPPLLGDNKIEVLGVQLSFDEILFLFVAAGVALFLRTFLFGTRLGTAMRAVVDDPELAGLSGAKPVAIARASWALGFALAGLSGILFASGRPLSALVLAFLVLNAYAAAMVGRLRSLPLTFAGAIVLGVCQELTNVDAYSTLIEALPGVEADFGNRFRLAIPALFLFAAMLALPQTRLRSSRMSGRDEPRVPGLRSTIVRGAAFVAFVAAIQLVVPQDRFVDLNRGLLYAVIILSLTLATGFGGQINLATYVFLALGASVMGNLFDGSSPLGLVAAAAVTAPVGIAVALPTLRLQGLYLALATFAFALAARDLLIGDRRILGTDPQSVGRPDFGIVGTDSDRAFMLFLAIVFVVLGIGLLALRRGKFGRRLAAVRDSEAACATLGMDVRWPKLALFAGSAAIAGMGGALFGGFSAVVSDINFDPIFNLQIFLFAFVGGVTTITGALIGGLLFTALTVLQTEQPALGGLVFAGIGAAAVALGKQPNGLAGMLYVRLDDLRARWQQTGRSAPPAEAAPPPSDTDRTLAMEGSP